MARLSLWASRAILLVACWLIVRTWIVVGVVVPLVVPSGSMAPTLLGVHRNVVCADCGLRFACGADQRSLAAVAICPNCGSMTNDWGTSPELAGDRVLIDRAAFAWRSPQRWEVVAFRHPHDARLICVKRVVGRPGEAVQIRDGDVYIDGQLQRKTLEQQRAMAVLVHDAHHQPEAGATLPPCWQGEPGSRWQWSGGRFLHSGGGGTMDWCVYHHWQWVPGRPGEYRETPVDDDSTYNRAWARRIDEVQPVDDLMLSFHVTQAEGNGRLAVRARLGQHEFLLRIDPTAGRYEALVDQSPLAQGAEPIPGYGRQPSHHWEVSLFDQQFLVAVDGRPLVTYPCETMDRETAKSGFGRLAIGCQGLSTEIRDVCVYRDVYYTRAIDLHARWGSDQPYRLGSDEYFVLGDNSPVSEDSRFWGDRPGVPAKLLYGRPFLVHFSSRSYPCFGGHIAFPDPMQIRLIR